MQELVVQNRIRYLPVFAGGIVIWLFFFSLTHDPGQVFASYSHFFFIGLIGAIIANSTGAGGGVVFIPAFAALGLSAEQALGTSIGIQCLGMTSGSLSWLWAAQKKSSANGDSWQLIQSVLIFGGIPSLIGVLAGQHLLPASPFPINEIFRVFSIIFGITLLVITLYSSTDRSTRSRLTTSDRVLVVLVSLIGGVVTSWISVGVGELLALLLFLRGYPPMIAVSVAVCVSAITVLAAAPFHLAAGDMVFEIILFAGPAAIIGGQMARYFSSALGAQKLKIFFGLWILVTGLVME